MVCRPQGILDFTNSSKQFYDDEFLLCTSFTIFIQFCSIVRIPPQISIQPWKMNGHYGGARISCTLWALCKNRSKEDFLRTASCVLDFLRSTWRQRGFSAEKRTATHKIHFPWRVVENYYFAEKVEGEYHIYLLILMGAITARGHLRKRTFTSLIICGLWVVTSRPKVLGGWDGMGLQTWVVYFEVETSTEWFDGLSG